RRLDRLLRPEPRVAERGIGVGRARGLVEEADARLQQRARRRARIAAALQLDDDVEPRIERDPRAAERVDAPAGDDEEPAEPRARLHPRARVPLPAALAEVVLDERRRRRL